MSAGMWEGLLAGYKSVEEKRTAREEKEEEVIKRRRTIINGMLPNIQKNLDALDEQRAMASALKISGLTPDTINALGQNPEDFKVAFNYVTSGGGVDLPPERLNDIFKAIIIGDEAPKDIFQSIKEAEELYRGFPEAEDPEAYIPLLNIPNRTTSFIETRLPQEVKPGIDPRMVSLYTLQAEVYDANLLAIARRDYNRMDQIETSGGELSEEDKKRKNKLLVDLDKYATNLNSRLELRGRYGEQAMTALLDSDVLNPETLSGIENNPFLFIVDEEEGAGFGATDVEPVAEELGFPPGTYVFEGFYYIPTPTGEYRKVPKV